MQDSEFILRNNWEYLSLMPLYRSLGDTAEKFSSKSSILVGPASSGKTKMLALLKEEMYPQALYLFDDLISKKEFTVLIADRSPAEVIKILNALYVKRVFPNALRGIQVTSPYNEEELQRAIRETAHFIDNVLSDRSHSNLLSRVYDFPVFIDGLESAFFSESRYKSILNALISERTSTPKNYNPIFKFIASVDPLFWDESMAISETGFYNVNSEWFGFASIREDNLNPLAHGRPTSWVYYLVSYLANHPKYHGFIETLWEDLWIRPSDLRPGRHLGTGVYYPSHASTSGQVMYMDYSAHEDLICTRLRLYDTTIPKGRYGRRYISRALHADIPFSILKEVFDLCGITSGNISPLRAEEINYRVREAKRNTASAYAKKYPWLVPALLSLAKVKPTFVPKYCIIDKLDGLEYTPSFPDPKVLCTPEGIYTSLVKLGFIKELELPELSYQYKPGKYTEAKVDMGFMKEIVFNA